MILRLGKLACVELNDQPQNHEFSNNNGLVTI